MAQKVVKHILVTLSKGEKNRGRELLDTKFSQRPYFYYTTYAKSYAIVRHDTGNTALRI